MPRWATPTARSTCRPTGGTAPPAVPQRLDIADRRGCDLDPVDPTTTEGRLTLTASVWADQVERLDRLRGALQLARRVPATVDRASLDAWVPTQLRRPPGGIATVVYHSVVAEYLDDATRERFTTAMATAGARADAAHPLAWVRLEPISELRHHGVAVTLWPEGATRTVARCGAHGADVEWLGDDNGPARG